MTYARREGDKDLFKKQLSDDAKVKGNSFYGKMINNLNRHKSTAIHVINALLTRHLDLHCLAIWKRLVGSIMSRSLSKLI